MKGTHDSKTSIWNPPLFSEGSCRLVNRYKTSATGDEMTFELVLFWNDSEVALKGDPIRRESQEGDNSETLLLHAVDGGFRAEYSAKLVSEQDTRIVKWESQLTPFAGKTLPYIGMWQRADSCHEVSSTAEQRAKSKASRQARFAKIISVISAIVGIVLLVAVCWFFFSL